MKIEDCRLQTLASSTGGLSGSLFIEPEVVDPLSWRDAFLSLVLRPGDDPRMSSRFRFARPTRDAHHDHRYYPILGYGKNLAGGKHEKWIRAQGVPAVRSTLRVANKVATFFS